MNEFTPEDRKALHDIGKTCARLDERTLNMDQRLDGHGAALRSTASRVGEVEVTQAKHGTRLKIAAWIGTIICSAIITGLLRGMFF